MNQASSRGDKKSRPGSGRILVLLIALALVIRIVAIVWRPMIEMDETSYVRMAENLASGLGPLEITGLSSTNFSPLFPLLIAGVAFMVGNFTASAYVVSAVFGSLLLLPVYLLGKELAGRRAGLMAAALVAVMPIFVGYSSRLYSENVYVFFLLMSIVFARHMLRGCRIPCSTLAGGSLGLAYLANPSAVFYLFVYLVLAVVVALRNGILPQMSRAALILVLFFSLYAAPYVVFLHHELGGWTYNGKAPGNAYAASKGLRHGTVEWEREMLALTDDGNSLGLYRLEDSADPVSNFLSSPGQAARNLARGANYLYGSEASMVMPLWLLPLMGLGLFAAGWTRTRAAGVGYLLVMMTPILLILTVYNAYTRLFMPLVALAVIWVAQGWEKMEDWARETVKFIWGEVSEQMWQPRLPWLIGALVILPVLAFSAATVLAHDYPTGYREAGEWLKPFADRDTKVMSRETSAAFYAGGNLVLLPYADYNEVTGYARNQGVDYLVISSGDIDERRPGLMQLKGEAKDHPEWQRLSTLSPGTGEEVFVFWLKG